MFYYHTDINENAAAHKKIRDNAAREISLSVVKSLRYIYEGHYRNNFIVPDDKMDVEFYIGKKITDNLKFLLFRSNTICGCLMICSMYKLSAEGKRKKQDKFLEDKNQLRTEYFHNLLLYYLVLNDTTYRLENSYDSDDIDSNDSGDIIDIDDDSDLDNSKNNDNGNNNSNNNSNNNNNNSNDDNNNNNNSSNNNNNNSNNNSNNNNNKN